MKKPDNNPGYKPVFKPGVALMRPAPLVGHRGRELKDQLTKRGFQVFDIAPTEHCLTHKAKPHVKESAYLFSSATALEALTLLGQQLDVRLPVMAVGAQTAQAAREYGFSNIIVGNSGLKQLFENEEITAFGNTLYVAADQPGHDLNSIEFRAGLQQAAKSRFKNLHIHHWPIYETRVSDASKFLLQNRSNLFQIRYLSFFSYRNASSFVQILENDAHKLEPGFNIKDKIATCFSTKIAECLQGLPFQSVEIATNPDRESYLELMDNLEGSEK